VSFQAPLLLATLAVIPLVAITYALMQRRRRRFAVRYTNVDLLAAVAGRSYTRHLPALLGLLALAALLIAIARPQRTVAAERREANVLLVTDTSGSMLATDVKPTRLAAGVVSPVRDEGAAAHASPSIGRSPWHGNHALRLRPRGRGRLR